jgi:SAM-dependent methyltransferase
MYRRYLSAFKGDPRGKVNVGRFWSWCDFRIRPWLDDLPRSAAVLELGCGPGYLLGYLDHIGFTSAEGIDLSAEQVAIARAQGCRAEAADVFSYLESKPVRYDAILAIDFIEHFTRAEVRSLAAAIGRSLRPGGRLILQTPNGQGLFAGHIIHGDATHESIYTPGSLQQVLTLAGYSGFEFRETGSVPRGLVGVLRSAAWGVMRVGLNVACKIATGRTYRIWTDNMLCRCTASPESRPEAP